MNLSFYNRTVDQFSDNVYRFILKNIRNEDKAKDIVQDTWLKLWENREKVNPEKVKSWLFTTSYRMMIDVLRREKKSEYLEDKHHTEQSHNTHYSGLNEVLDKALNTLPDVQKQVVLLRDYEGYNYAEIGEITGLTEAQVKVYIFRARKALKVYIGSIDAVI